MLAAQPVRGRKGCVLNKGQGYIHLMMEEQWLQFTLDYPFNSGIVAQQRTLGKS